MSEEKIQDKEIQEAMSGEVVDLPIMVASETDLSFYDLNEVDFDEKWNIRRPDKYRERVARKVQELLTDKYIRTPLEVAQVSDQGEVLRGVKGFIRYRALAHICEKYPDTYAEYFQGKVPYTLILCTEEERERLMMDHGSEELLDEYELLLAVERYLKRGYTEKQLAVVLTPLFFQLTNMGTKREFTTRVQAINETGHFEKFYDMGEMQLAFWRRRIQFFKRIIAAGPLAMNEFKRGVDGERPRITQAQAEKLKEATNGSEIQNILAPDDPKEPAPKGMGRAKIVEYLKVCHSKTLCKLMNIVLGELPQAELQAIEEMLVAMEKE